MTITTNIVKLEDGPRNLVLHLTGYVGAGEAETLTNKTNIALEPPLLAAYPGKTVKGIVLERIMANTSVLAVQLWWSGATPGLALTIPANFSMRENFLKNGGALHTTAGSPDGDMLLSTVNASNPPADGTYDIQLWFRKTYD